MQLQFDETGTILKAKITGELDHHEASVLREKIDLKLSSDIFNNLILDFSELSFMDSSGIALIMGRVKYIEALNGKVKVIVNQNIERMLKIAGLDKYVDIERNGL